MKKKKKKNEQVEKIDNIEKGRLWGFIFHHSTKIFSFEKTQKLYWGRILEGLHEFIKFNPYSYNILKIKNILSISINLSFSRKISL